MSTGASATHRGRGALWLVLLVALLVGIVAALLRGAAPANGTPPAGQVIINLPTEVWGLLFLSPLIVGFAALILRRLLFGSRPVPSSAVVAFVVVLALLTLFVFLVHGGNGNQGTVTVAPGPPKGGGGGTGNSSGCPNCSPSSPKNATAPAISFVIGPWVLLALLLGLGTLVAALAVPGVISRLVDRGPRPTPAPGEEVHEEARAETRAALAEAGAALGRGDDPRTTIVRLYVRLLEEIAPRIGDVAPLTADEIQRGFLVRLGVSGPASEALTRLFEEARYSTHPLGPHDAGRCRSALERVELDLARVAVP